jgi:hypothetical protein
MKDSIILLIFVSACGFLTMTSCNKIEDKTILNPDGNVKCIDGFTYVQGEKSGIWYKERMHDVSLQCMSNDEIQKREFKRLGESVNAFQDVTGLILVKCDSLSSDAVFCSFKQRGEK